jgi:hypothetical protein
MDKSYKLSFAEEYGKNQTLFMQQHKSNEKIQNVNISTICDTTGKTEELNFKALCSIEEMTDNVRKL